MRIGLDVDGVMYHFQKTACYMLNKEFGYSLSPEAWSHWNWPKDIVDKKHWQWLWGTGVKNGLFRYGHLYKGTIEAVRDLSNRGDVVIITSRPRHAVQDTLDWISYINLPIREVHILSDGEPKSSVRHCDFYVDDKPENIEDYYKNTNGHPMLWRRSWNSTYGTDPELYPFYIVNSWEEVIGHVV